MFNLRELLQPIRGAATSVKDKLINLQDKAGEAITGSYEVKKLNDTTNVVTDKPNILGRIGGQRTEEYVTKKQEPRPPDTTIPTMSYNTGIEFNPSDIEAPRKEGLFNKLRDKVEDVFDGDEQAASLPESQNIIPEPQVNQINNQDNLIKEQDIDDEIKKKLDFVPKDFATSSKPVPEELRPIMVRAAKHTGMDVSKLRAQFGGESHESWDPKTRGWQDPTDIGISQLNLNEAVPEITQPRGENGSYWDQNFGNEYGPFDINNATHQILGAAIYLNWLRNDALPEAGIKNPTDEDVSIAYNMGAGRYAKVKSGRGDGDDLERYNGYKGLLERHGYYQ
jgi:hypothetical protein